MVTANNLIKMIVGVKDVKINSFDIVENEDGIEKLTVDVTPHVNKQCRCPYCDNHKKLPRYDSSDKVRSWRGLDVNGVIVEIRSEQPPRVTCPVHGIVTADVPWAFPCSHFTKAFDLTVAWLARSLNKLAVSEFMRISWATVGRCISRTREYLEPDVSGRLNHLKRIGIDETSYSKGHKYITTVVNHDTKSVVWVCKGHGYEVLKTFFETLTQEQKDTIEVVSGDGARWITDCVEEYCPQAMRCTDPFHVVEWANEALDDLRKEAWRKAQGEYKKLKKDNPRGKGRPAVDDEKAQELKTAREFVSEIKNSRYALGKAPENLTEKQNLKLAQIRSRDPKLYRAYELKESLRHILKLRDVEEAEESLNDWIAWAHRSQIDEFKELADKIQRHKPYILNFIRTGCSNARVEALNNKISLLVHRSYGFRNFGNLVDMVMLICSNLVIPLPNRKIIVPQKA